MMLFRFLKLFGVDVPGRVAQLQANFEKRVEAAKDQVRQAAQTAAIVAALAGFAGLAALSAAGVGLIALYRWVLETYGQFYGLAAVGAVLVVIAIILAAGAFLEARSWSTDVPRNVATEAPVDRAAADEATGSDDPLAAAQHSPQPLHTATSAADLVEPLSVILSRVMKFPTTGNLVMDELLFTLRGSVTGAADEVVDGVVHTVRYGDRTKLAAVLGTAVLVGWLLARHRTVVSD